MVLSMGANDWKKKNKDKWAIIQKRSQLKNKYGLTLEQAAEIKSNGCNVCGRKTGILCIDHNHITGKVRGCLCVRCNRGLGLFKDSPQLIESLFKYISEYST